MPRHDAPALETRCCDYCGDCYQPVRVWQRFDCQVCRQAAFQDRRLATAVAKALKDKRLAKRA